MAPPQAGWAPASPSELRLHHLEALGPVLGFTLPEIVAEAYGITWKMK